MGFVANSRTDQQKIDWRTGTDTSNASPSPLSVQTLPTLTGELTEENAILAGITANIRSGFILFNRAENIIYINLSAKRLLCAEDEMLHTQAVFDTRKALASLAANPASAQIELDRLWSEPEKESFTDLALSDAAVRWLRIHTFPVRDKPDHLLGRGVLLDDITLERSAAQSRNETLAMAAHELKTPLAIIKGSATTLLSTSIRWDQSAQREMLQMIDTQTDRLHEILNTLLDVWRLDAGAQHLRISEIQISELLLLLVERWRKNAPHHQIYCEFDETAPPIYCDPTRIEQVFHHLLHNAVKYSPDGGTIRLVLETGENELRLSLSDQGIGIASEHLERIFDRFYRIREGAERSQSSGLGLAIVRASIEAHGGRIWADSPGPGEGSVFFCTLPLTPPTVSSWEPTAQNVPAQISHTTAALPRQSKRVYIAVVESDPRIARYLRANLEEQQYHVQVFNHGSKFLRQFDLEEPELILLAGKLTDMSGTDLLQRLREFSHAPVMMLCNDDSEDERVHLLDMGADDLLSKPFGTRELLARLRALLRRQIALKGEKKVVESIFTTGDLSIDYAQHQVLQKGLPIQLSRTEYKLLSTLAQNAGRVMTHELLLERVWGAEYNREVDFIWVYISRLRRKVEPDPRHPRYIVTVPDVGYKLAKL